MMDSLNSLGKLDRLERRVHRLTVDAVTGLLKKEGLIDRILEKDHDTLDILSSSIAVISLDFDGFKEINDKYGHQSGDVYLKKISHEIDKFAWGKGNNTGFAFRGKEGDEIVVVLKINGDESEYKSRVQAFQSDLNSSLIELGKEFVKIGIDRKNPSLSVGCVFANGGVYHESPSEALGKLLNLVDHEADKAMYLSKERKPNKEDGKLVEVTFFEEITNV